eukprot:scaffold36669_cov47-Attheya_sp.AAC.2
MAAAKGMSPVVIDQRNLLDEIDTLSLQLIEEWTGEIFFPCIPIANPSLSGTIFHVDLQRINVCDYLNNGGGTYQRLYFDPKKYQSPFTNNASDVSIKSDASWKLLKDDFQRAAHESGSPIVANGGSKDVRWFVCKYKSRVYQVNKSYIQSSQAEGPFRQDALINCDKGGRRQNGRAMKRRTTTGRALCPDKKCPFKIMIRWDKFGFYINLFRASGCPSHKNHPKIDPENLPFPTKLLPKEEQENLRHLADSCAWSGVGRNYIFSKLGKFVTRAKIPYLQDNTPSKLLEPRATNSDVDSLISFFESSEEISYQVLWDVQMNNSTTGLVSETKIPNHENNVVRDLSSAQDMFENQELTQNARKNQQIPIDSKVFVAIAWSSQNDIRMFKLFPEVMHIDATCDSSNKKNALLTFSIRTSTAKQFVFLKVWLPNQKRSSFRWVFRYVLPEIISRNILLRTKLVMVDGDQQQNSELKLAIKSYMSHAHFSQCGWHIVCQGWKRHGPSGKAITGQKKSVFDQFLKHVKNWMYSFMRPNKVESKEEFELSKKLLFCYVSGEAATRACDGNKHILEQITTFIRDYFLIYDETFLFYLRMFIRHFNVSTNSAHEGTNFGLKNHAANVKPSHNLTNAAKAMTFQSNVKIMQVSEESTRNVLRENLHSIHPSRDNLTSIAVSILDNEFERIHCYEVKHVSKSCWQVFLKTDQESNYNDDALYESDNDSAPEDRPVVAEQQTIPSQEDSSPIPVFRRTRTVTASPGSVMSCSCGNFERTGLSCAHIMAIISHHDSGWCGFTHHDVSVRWWKNYLQYGYKASSGPLGVLFEVAMSRDILGPKLPFEEVTPTKYDDMRVQSSIVETVWNYKKETIMKLLSPPSTNVSSSSLSHRQIESMNGLTQESYIVEDQYETTASQLRDEVAEDVSESCEVFDRSISDMDGLTNSKFVRQHFTGMFNELMSVLESSNDLSECKRVEALFTNEISLIRGKIGRGKRKLDQGATYCINVEEEKQPVKRRYASHNM